LVAPAASRASTSGVDFREAWLMGILLDRDGRKRNLSASNCEGAPLGEA
jgi:hypothetical protein